MFTCDELFRYHTKDNTLTIEFALTQGTDGWRAYILTPIDYCGRPDSMEATSRLYDPTHDLCYVCWNPPPHSLELCEAVAALWSDLTVAYVYTGEPIFSQYQRRFYGGLRNDNP